MGKKRIYELAKEINVSSKQIIAKAEEKGFPVKNHMSTLGENEERQLREAFKPQAKTSHEQSAASAQPQRKVQQPRREKSQGTARTQTTAQKPAGKPANQTQRNNNNKNNGQTGNRQHEQQHSGTGRFGGSLNNNTNNSNGRRNSNNSNSRGGRNSRNNRNNRRRNNNNNNRYKKNQRIKDTNQHKGAPERKNKALPEVLVYTDGMNAQDLAKILHRSSAEIVKKLFMLGVMVNQNQSLDKDTIEILADDYGIQAQEKVEVDVTDIDKFFDAEMANKDFEAPRAPVVTIMGHVDHGKTTLLDHLRHSHITDGEAGGITQAIGAYQVHYNDKVITFLDTPGHAAFTEMRARGAEITDITVLVVAADDGVMPQTIEAIHHAKAAGTPIIVAVNKIDKPGANPDRIREDLANMNLLVEEWGGKYQCQEISAKKGIGVHDLLDKVLLEADMLDLKANPNRRATGTIIESSLDKGRGYVSTVLVANGTLKVGDIVLAGTSWGRVKAMFNERNANIKSAAPAEPAIILGLNGAPTAGDQFHVIETEQEAREIANKREQLQREQGLRTQKRLTLGDISHRIARGEFHELNVIVKGDTDGSVEALSDSFIKLSTEKVQVNVVNKAVGQISENDVMLASASDAVIVGFQVRPSADARKAADREGVEINTYSIIYDAIDDIKSAMVGMLDKVKKEIVTGQVEVKQTFKISKVGTIAGGLVTEGKVHAKDKARVIRDGIVIRTAEIGALKRYKDDVKEVVTGMECGLSLVNYNDIQEGDVIETFTEIEVEQKL